MEKQHGKKPNSNGELLEMNEGGDTIKQKFLRNNIAPLQTQPVPNPMAKGHYFHNMVELLWLDGTSMFGCQICGQMTPTRAQMSIHVGTHNPANAIKRTKRKYKKRTERLTTDKAISKVDKLISDLEAERDYYKALARKYAKQLNTLKDLFSVDKELL